MARSMTTTETNEQFDVDEDGVITEKNKQTTHHSTKEKGEKEEDYVKIFKYTNTLFAFKGISLALVPYIIEISKYMTFTDVGQTVHMDGFVKERVAKVLGVSLHRVNQAIGELAKCDVLRKTKYRGTYVVNPFICAYGETMKINELQIRFDYEADLMHVSRIESNLITGRDVKRVIHENKMQKD